MNHQRGQFHILILFHTMEKCFAIFPHYGKMVGFGPRLSLVPKRNLPSAIRARNARSTLWKTFFAASLLALAGCSKSEPLLPELPAGQDVSISASMSTNQIRIGDPVHLTLTALHKENMRVEFPNIAQGKEVLVRSSTVTNELFPNGWVKTEQQIVLTSMTVTNHVIGEKSSILISTPEGTRTNAYPFLSLEVMSSLTPGEKEPRAAKGGLAYWPAPPSRWIWIVLAALAVLAAAFFALRKFLTTPRTILHMPKPIPPYQIALDALDSLRAKGWIETLTIEPFYVELSAIVRLYLEGRFGLRAPERTTEEFIRDALTSRKLSDAHQNLVAGFLEQSDLVKFARHAPGQTDMRNALDSAAALVHETMPVETTEVKS